MSIEFLTTDDVADILNKNRQFVQAEIRKGKIKAVKIGKEYKISKEDLNSYMGISNTEEEYKKDLYIKELESKVKHYEFVINTIRSNLSNINLSIKDI